VLAGPLARDFMDPLGSAIDQLGLAEHVELTGAVDHEDVPRVLSRATVCVAPAAPDLAERPLAGLPTKILEYLSCGRAVVAARRSSVREIIQDGVEGLLFDPASPRELADKILRLLADPSLRSRLGEAGQRRVRSRYPASGLRRKLLAAYTDVLPPSTWNPVGSGAPRLSAHGHDSGSGSNPPHLVAADLLDDANLISDTSPALSADASTGDDADTGNTVVTRAVTEGVSNDETASGDTGETRTGEETEAWLVIAGDGSISRQTLIGGPSAPGGSPPPPADGEGDGTPSDGVRPEPEVTTGGRQLPGRFVAGELDVPGTFVAAGEILGPTPPPEPAAPAAGAPASPVAASDDRTPTPTPAPTPTPEARRTP
jgi:hypothetical protein